MYDLFDRLDAQFARHLANRADPERQTLELLFGGVRRDFESHGIVADLIWVALLYACHNGYEEVMAKATSRSQRTFHRYGLVTLAEVPYQDFEYQGTRPFETISSPATAKLMWARPETFFRHYPGPLARRAHL
ncbi:uncharacterized protein LDX57_010273 [Aspergillus melleus]|uniref:uncharacterized protein n=1 Tax=Aspergillus melleus TaxID=138277 RepID=UPI001E8EDF7F|nr:uncharacterized protein LDX57_010273 [Aspergillus melleus]KAH8432646.1 hypothetical protein LDX57_010273 [Aspergillus melleus]